MNATTVTREPHCLPLEWASIRAEAENQATPTPRLLELIETAGVTITRGRSDDGYALQRLVLGNPSCPLSWLARSLIIRTMPECWLNPSTLLVLQTMPSDLYEPQALRTLRAVSTYESFYAAERVETLREAVELWASTKASDTNDGRALAKRLAFLFSLPWPEDA